MEVIFSVRHSQDLKRDLRNRFYHWQYTDELVKFFFRYQLEPGDGQLSEKTELEIIKQIGNNGILDFKLLSDVALYEVSALIESSI